MSNEKKPRSVLGRMVVIGLFTVVVGYFSFAIFGSIISQLYGQPPVEQDAAGDLDQRERTWCVRSIVGLRDELEGQVTLELQHPKREGDPAARWTLWRSGWHAKLATAHSRCVGAGNTTLDHAYQQLAELEVGYGVAVDRVILTRTDISAGLQEALSHLKKQR
jgi:hypothetical protein